MTLYIHAAQDSQILLGPTALKEFNYISSPSANLTQKTMYTFSGNRFFEQLSGVYPFMFQYIEDWKPYYILQKDFSLRDGIFIMEKVDLATGETSPLPVIDLKDYKKDITIKYKLVKADNIGVEKTTTITKKSLASFVETLLLIKKDSEPFIVLIKNSSLKDEYRTA